VSVPLQIFTGGPVPPSPEIDAPGAAFRKKSKKKVNKTGNGFAMERYFGSRGAAAAALMGLLGRHRQWAAVT